MAIDKVKKVTFLSPTESAKRLLSHLYDLSILHITDTFEKLEQVNHPLKKHVVVVEEPAKYINKLEVILSTFALFVKKKKGLLESFFPLPLQVTEKELRDVLSTIDIEPLYEESHYCHNEFKLLEKKIADIKREISSLASFLKLPWDLDELRKPRRVSIKFGIFSSENWKKLEADPIARDLLTFQTIDIKSREIKVLVAYLLKEQEEVLKKLKEFDFVEPPLPAISGRVSDKVAALKAEMNDLLCKQEHLRKQVIELSRYSRHVEVLLRYWENEKDKITAQGNFGVTRRVLVITGFVREKDIDKLNTVLNTEFPKTSVVYETPTLKDDVPVSITLPAFFRPAQLLINMFGMPDYFSFDPTPFITLSFLIFFGICFGDVFYGIALIGLSLFIVLKYRSYDGIKNFFMFFMYAGFSSAIFGALSGTWAGDLYNPEYLGEDNLLLKARNALIVLDPLSKPVVALVVAIGLGVANQFYGIVLRMYRELLRKNVFNAIFDGLLWLILLPGMLIIVSPMFTKIPDWLFNLGVGLTGVGAIGLILTQGRHEKSMAARVVIGFVSLYGILGTYGCTSFIGDILSYSRLLALGLTTAIVAMAFNIIAGIMRDVPYVGIILFVLILIGGHVFNFMMSIIGAFVHPARLIFLEFFGRFYQAGAIKFKPFGFDNEKVQLLRLKGS
ncbi:MAG: V-type ATP synthase subunit I [Candidatus Brocadiales bacterium]